MALSILLHPPTALWRREAQAASRGTFWVRMDGASSLRIYKHRLAATHVVRDLGALPPDAILYLLAQPLLDLASDHLMRDRDLTTRYEERFEVEDSDEWTATMTEYNREADAITAAIFRAEGEAGLAHLYLTDRRTFDRRMERGRQHFLGPPSGAHAAYLRSKGIIE